MTTITVEREVPLREVFVEETETVDNPHTKITEIGGRTVEVSPATESAVWRGHEIRAIEDSPWRIVNVGSGEYGPTLTIQRE